MSESQKRWIQAIVYVAFIYATLSIAGAPIKYLRHHNMLRISLFACWLAALIFLIRTLSVRGLAQAWRISSVVIIFISFILIGRRVATPEEQLHFFEYGLVGVLFIRALRNQGELSLAQLGVALILAALSGWVDELLQGLTPGRHYDVRDVGLNILSAGMGLLIYAVFHARRRNLSSSIHV